MSERQAKTLNNPSLREKFKVGQVVGIPKRVAQRHSSNLQAIRPVLGKVTGVGDRQVGKHFRFAIDVSWQGGTAEIWEEWQLELVHNATPDQVQRCSGYPWLL